jgi:hypothetical protein
MKSALFYIKNYFFFFLEIKNPPFFFFFFLFSEYFIRGMRIHIKSDIEFEIKFQPNQNIIYIILFTTKNEEIIVNKWSIYCVLNREITVR